MKRPLDSNPESNPDSELFDVKGVVRFDSKVHDKTAIAGMSVYLQGLIRKAMEHNPTCHTVITQTKPWPGDTHEDLIALMAAKGLKVIK